MSQQYLKLSEGHLKSKGGIHTAREICQQPEMWRATYAIFEEQCGEVSRFLTGFLENEHVQVILTGAGTSAYLGETLTGVFQRRWGVCCKAVCTTDIVTHPKNYFIKSKPTLLISFARSGDSPESEATIALARKYCSRLYELSITCNAEGKLAQMASGNGRSYVFVLPQKTNDKSLAMTSSFSSMLFAGLLIAEFKKVGRLEKIVDTVCRLGEYILANYLDDFKKIAGFKDDRMVFLASALLYGVAHESQLKLQELTNGEVIGASETFLGFRHGPRVILNNSTTVFYLISNNPFVAQYELDFVYATIHSDFYGHSMAIGFEEQVEGLNCDCVVKLPKELSDIPEDYLSVLYVLPAQIIGFYKSLNYGLSPDAPSSNGTISRVVQGVRIYDIQD
ncbi:SIS domain-containing protein [Pseudozobellia thermophila]|uniref:Galactosamine 6-phosphate isomerase AgaS n=1 Tax=Pseudozobellia thermophila TaxID=192903 RepID=A0A1M6NM03_9FLAO|nr:SIS domain-containing protein [Pseudozobellia thermophila]SHJ96749.1 galactosamine 6-phosphate isomerase AgaS [Pseudozobellia thermophila]